jgi:hypothetical protein
MDTHKNARLTPKGREEMVGAVVEGGLSKAAAPGSPKHCQSGRCVVGEEQWRVPQFHSTV